MKKITLLLLLVLPLFLFAQSFSGTTGAITDDNQANEYSAVVSNLAATSLNANLGLVTVCLDITHTYDSDLVIKLVSPNGTMITLFSGIGGDGDDFTNTCLSQSSTTSISSEIAPFTGVFSPQESLANMNNNQNGNGVWKLVIVDTYGQDAGILNSWSLEFGTGASVPIVFSESNLPIVVINTNGQTIVDEPSISADMKIIDNGPGILNHISDVANNYNGKITIEYRGAYSQSLPQKPYKIETKDALNVDLNVSVLGMPAEHDWVLVANYNDKSFVRNTLAYKLFAEMGYYSARSKYCEVVVNGVYQGIYLFMEKLKRDSNRIAIAKLLPNENTGIDLTGGYIIKTDYWDDSNSWILNYHPLDHPDFDIRLVYEYPKPLDITAPQKTYIQTFVNDLETALYSPNFTDPINGYQKYLDTDSFIDYFIINELSRNNDGFKKSCYFNKDKDGLTANAKLKAGPVWDFDWAWKNLWGCFIFENTDGSGWAHNVNDCFGDNYSTGWYYRLLQDVAFQNKLRCRWNYFRTSILSNSVINSYINETASFLNQAQVRHYEKWPILGNPNSGASEVDNDPATYAGQIQKLKDWISLRTTWLDANMPGDGNNCSLATANATIKHFQLAPNPAKDFIQISNSNSELIQSVKIYDTTGKVIYLAEINENTTTINVSGFANGIYNCKINYGSNKQEVSRLVVLH